MMMRKVMIALAATAFVGAMVAATTADARSRGHSVGYSGGSGMRVGGYSGGSGMRVGGYSGGHGMRVGSFSGGKIHSGSIGHRGSIGFAGGHPKFVGHHKSVGHHKFVGHRFHHGRKAVFAAPFFAGAAFASYYDDPCWELRYTPWGATYVDVCGYDYW